MLKFLKYANKLRSKYEYQLFEKATADPEKAQRSFLLRLIKENAGSKFGNQHNFDAIRNISDFHRRVPIRDYEDFRPYINQIISGERAVLTRQDPFMFTMTSGTTDEPKYIPVTKRSQSLNSSLMRQWVSRAEADHPEMLGQASVAIVSRAVEGLTDSGLPFGSASGVIYKNIPSFIRRAYAIPYAVSEIKDYDDRNYVLARFALSGRVSAIATANATTLLRLARACDEHKERLIRAIHMGSLGINLKNQNKVMAELASGLKPDPIRAWQLRENVQKNGFLRLGDCWSDLRLVGCWLGGSVGVQAAKLAEHFGDIPLRDLGFMSSEGNFTLPISDQTSSGILAIKNNFYEFIPEPEIESPNPQVLSAHELEIGKRYSILLTTAAGLYRYKIDDIVEVTGFYKRTPLIAFVRKAGEMTNITGEKMHVNHFIQAFSNLSLKLKLEVEQFKVISDVEACRYEIYLELKENLRLCTSRRGLLRALDDEMKRVNIEYRQKRNSGRLSMPVIFLMKIGWAEAGLRRHISEGKRDTQYKAQILCRRRTVLENEFVAEFVSSEISVLPAENAAARIKPKPVVRIATMR